MPPLTAVAAPSRSAARIAPAWLLIVALLALGVAMLARLPSTLARSDAMADSIARLSAEVSRLRQEQSMPALVLSRHRDSICYIYALYSLSFPDRRTLPLRTRVSATGFVVADGLIATNRHVVQPWWEDEQDQAAIRAGAIPRMEKLLAFFPGLSLPLNLTNVEAGNGDVAVVHFQAPQGVTLRPLPLATAAATPGDPVVVVGYPMGVTVMLAKSPRRFYQRLAYSTETDVIARDLAAHSLIRPSATYGHLGDVVGDRFIYDAPTAQGGSGGPVFNSQGAVIAVNSAYIDGFAGGTLGVSVDLLRPLIARAPRK